MNTPKSKVDYGIVLFETTQAVIKAEKILNEAGIKIKLIPVPRHISSDCGISILFDLNLIDKIKSILSEKNIHYSNILPF
ncbi:TPA: DUF3343 domain-containing protein [Candidatus Poribacteria bacterium]|nr:DUF3343 domain-containing protein [Candidatus Poribacteria bacterium]